MAARDKAELRKVEVSLNVGILKLQGTWEADVADQQAAWEIYIELITRIAVQELKSEEGIFREALTSLYSIFPITREVLKKYGPKVAIPKGRGTLSLAQIAVAVLNECLRPFLAKWHPRLVEYESLRPANVSIAEHERAWNSGKTLREELNQLRTPISAYATVLAEAAGIQPLALTSTSSR